MKTPEDMKMLKGMCISLGLMIDFCMAEYGLDRVEAEKRARIEAEKAGVKLIEDAKPCV